MCDRDGDRSLSIPWIKLLCWSVDADHVNATLLWSAAFSTQSCLRFSWCRLAQTFTITANHPYLLCILFPWTHPSNLSHNDVEMFLTLFHLFYTVSHKNGRSKLYWECVAKISCCSNKQMVTKWKLDDDDDDDDTMVMVNAEAELLRFSGIESLFCSKQFWSNCAWLWFSNRLSSIRRANRLFQRSASYSSLWVHWEYGWIFQVSTATHVRAANLQNLSY